MNVPTRTAPPAALPMIVVLLMVASTFAVAQPGMQSYGRLFLVAFPDTARSIERSAPATDIATIAIFSQTAAHVDIVGPGIASSVTAQPGASTIISLTDPGHRASAIYLETPDKPSRNVFRVSSDEPIAISCYFATPDGAEAFSPLPVESWGNEYIAMALASRDIHRPLRSAAREEGFSASDAPSQLVVIAAFDATAVTVETPIDVPGAFTRRFMLNAGEACLIQSPPPSPGDSARRDLSGARIVSDKPVGVLSGAARGEVGAGARIERMPTGNTARNTVTEWMPPLTASGGVFVYVPGPPVGDEPLEEVIRIYPTSPGVTTVTTSGLPAPQLVQAGSFAEYRSTDWALFGANRPLAFRTDKPASAMVATGSRAVQLSNDGAANVQTWAPATSELPPYGRWLTSGAWHAPARPLSLRHWALIAADTGAVVTLDGNDVSGYFQQVKRSPFKTALVPVGTGDHTIQAVGGRYSAIAFGRATGYEQVRALASKKESPAPLGIGEGSDRTGDSSLLPHPTEYDEELAYTYALPVVGVTGAPNGDTLEITLSESCDSTQVILSRPGSAWISEPPYVALDPASINTDLTVREQTAQGLRVRYVLRLAPTDKWSDAAGAAIVTDPTSGIQHRIPFIYRARPVTCEPARIALPVSPATIDTVLTLTNRAPFPITIESLSGTAGDGAAVVDSTQFPRTLAPGERRELRLRCRADRLTSPDTIIIGTDCRPLILPIDGGTGRPKPTITGHDWRLRAVGSRHDTLSMISNIGAVAYRIASVTILDDPTGTFSLIAPDWSAGRKVDPEDSVAVGIRFAPQAEGEFRAEIELTTTDGLTARAQLHGIAQTPSLLLAAVTLDTLCNGASVGTTLVARNPGAEPVPISHIEIMQPEPKTFSCDTARLGLPRVLAPGDSLRIPIRFRSDASGTFQAQVGIYSNNDVIASAPITATVRNCAGPVLTVNDHDFGELWITTQRQGEVIVRNPGAIDVRIDDVDLIDDDGLFDIDLPSLPLTVRAGTSITVPCSFHPIAVGLRTGRIRFIGETGELYARLQGVGRAVAIPASIARDYHGEPGTEITITLDAAPLVDTVTIDSLNIAIRYNAELLRIRSVDPKSQDIVPGSLTWRFSADSIICRARMRGNYAPQGILIAMRFAVTFAPTDISEFPFTIDAGLPYVEFIESPGLFVRDPICGLRERLFSLSDHDYYLGQSVPNPTTGSTRIDFEIAFEERATIMVYDLLGRTRLVLLNAVLPAGRHSVTVPAGSLPSGIYCYRLSSGSFTSIGRMIVQ